MFSFKMSWALLTVNNAPVLYCFDGDGIGNHSTTTQEKDDVRSPHRKDISPKRFCRHIFQKENIVTVLNQVHSVSLLYLSGFLLLCTQSATLNIWNPHYISEMEYIEQPSFWPQPVWYALTGSSSIITLLMIKYWIGFGNNCRRPKIANNWMAFALGIIPQGFLIVSTVTKLQLLTKTGNVWEKWIPASCFPEMG